jgi:hypothetical protein
LRDLLEVPLALELFFANAMCFVAMQFSESNPTIPQANPRDALDFPAGSPFATASPQTRVGTPSAGCARI